MALTFFQTPEYLSLAGNSPAAETTQEPLEDIADPIQRALEGSKRRNAKEAADRGGAGTAAELSAAPTIAPEAIDKINSIRALTPQQLAEQFDNDDVSLVDEYRKNRSVYDSDPVTAKKFLEAYQVARTHPVGVGDIVEGFFKGVASLPGAVAGGVKQTATDLATGRGDRTFSALKSNVDDYGNLAADATRNVGRLFRTGTNKPVDEAGWREDFNREIGELEQFDKTVALGSSQPVSEEDKAAVRNQQIVVDPLNAIPFGAGANTGLKMARAGKSFQVLSRTGEVLREIPIVSKAGQLIDDAVKSSKNVVASGLEKVGKGAGNAGRFSVKDAGLMGAGADLLLTGAAGGLPVSGILGGVIAKKAVELAGDTALGMAGRLRGTLPPGPVSRAASQLLNNPRLTNIRRGAVAGLAGDIPTTALTGVTLLGSDNLAEAGQALGTQSAFGALGGLFAPTASPASTTELRPFSEIRAPDSYVPPVDTPTAPVISADYGTVPEWDAAHKAAQGLMNPEQQQIFNRFREAFRKDAEIYNLSSDDYARAVVDRAQLRQPDAPLSDSQIKEILNGPAGTAGLFADDFKDANGVVKKRVFTNTDGGALQHEAGHLVFSLLTPDQQKKLVQSVRKNYTPNQIAEHRADYETALGSEISEPYLIEEIIAENFDQLTRGIPLEQLGVPKAFSTAADTALRGAFDKKTDIGFRPDIGVAGDLTASLRQQGLIRPAAPVTPAPSASGIIRPAGAQNVPNIRTTVADQNRFQKPVDRGDTGVEEAYRAVVNGNYTPEQRAGFTRVSEALNAGRPVEINYQSVNTDTYGQKRSARRKEQDDAYQKERSGILPEAIRSTVQKVIIPTRYETKGDRVQLLGHSLDKVLANAYYLVGEADAKSVKKPFEVINGALTTAGWADLVDKIKKTTANQAAGYSGEGKAIKVPTGYKGVLPTQDPNYTPVLVDADKANFVNMLFGTPPPKTAVKGTARTASGVPANVSAQKLAAANQRPLAKSVTSTPGKTRFEKFDLDIAEVNPLRDEYARAGVPIRELLDSNERVNLENFKNEVKVRSDLNISRPSTDLIRAGFKPDPRKAARISNPEVTSVAERYTAESGLPYQPFDGYAKLDEELGKRIADHFDKAGSNPGDPSVQNAYRSLIAEVRGQYQSMLDNGYDIEPWTDRGEPYKSSADMVKDVAQNKHLWLLPTVGNFGSREFDVGQNPMLAPTDVVIGDYTLSANDLFRAVHDFYGHAKEGYEFGPRGEFNAFLAHQTMFSPEAVQALANETLAQNAWVNFGPQVRRSDGTVPRKGEQGFVPLTERPFADQKVNIIPRELIDEALNSAGLGEGVKDFQYTVFEPDMKDAQGRRVVQIDDVRGGTRDGNRSASLDDFRKEGVDLPDVPADLPAGRYTLAQIRALTNAPKKV